MNADLGGFGGCNESSSRRLSTNETFSWDARIYEKGEINEKYYCKKIIDLESAKNEQHNSEMRHTLRGGDSIITF
jgi:hypothetical protein